MNLFVRQNLENIASFPAFLQFVFIIIHRSRQLRDGLLLSQDGWELDRRWTWWRGWGLGPTLNNTLDIIVRALHSVSSPPPVRFQMSAWLRLPSLTSNNLLSCMIYCIYY